MITWSEQYEIGIPVIDRQHQRIVDYINQVQGQIESELDAEKMGEILNLLVDYTLSHFEFEEALMEEAHYEHLEEHQLSHKTFIGQIELLHQRFKNGENIAELLAQILLDWLLQHIRDDDASYAPIVKQHILGEAPESHAAWAKSAFLRYFKH
ncbi:hemerythrin [Alteromonadaceae bacterium Bs31]|nr:hemerythrin [Alteromonadaceae bacterium Bs31]